MNNITKLIKCRFCYSKNIKKVFSLGKQHLTGVFPKKINKHITTGYLELALCKKCSLLQLNHSYDSNEMYGKNYGYRTSLNVTMIKHIASKISKLEKYLLPGDTVLDIGSNDCTLLKSYSKKNINKIGIDPVGIKFKKYYSKNNKLISKFFSAKNYNVLKYGKAKIITSLAVFYDLDAPYDFARDVEKILHKNGIWHFEQSYMPIMLKKNSYDTICHEHLEYYSLKVINKIIEKAKLKIHDVEINDINGGSIAITVVKENSKFRQKNSRKISYLLNKEKREKISTLKPYNDFEKRVKKLKDKLIQTIKKIHLEKKVIFGYGASTKGNVVLQYCKINNKLLPFIAEVNEDKFNKFTPGSNIPIISEKVAHNLKPDYFLVFPWHFKKMIIKKEKNFLKNGGKLIFPFPKIEIIDKNYKDKKI